jgi:hypothetical protein
MNLFANIPVLAANGAGAPVNVSAMGAGKTIIVGGGFDASVTIEYATDLAGTVWAPVPGGTFDGPGRAQVDLAARWLRAVTEAYKSGTPNADVGASGSGALFLELVAGNPGPAVDISLLPALKTVVVEDDFTGSVAIEISNDGISWTQAMVFNNGGGQTLNIYGQQARVRASSGSTPSVWMGAANTEGAGPSDNSAGANFVYRPGGVAGGNVYTDWAALMAAKALVQGWKTIQFDGSAIFPANIVIPTGIYDMTETEWFGYSNPTGVLPPQRYIVETNDSQFPNLRAISGELQVNNTNTTVPMITLPATGQQMELGMGPLGAFPIINNVGTQPWVDASALAGGAQFLLRMQGSIQGTSPAINFGASTGFRCIIGAFDQSNINAGMIIGTDPGCQITAIVHSSANMASQFGFAGIITKGSGGGINPAIGLTRFYFSPYTGFPNVPAGPSAVDISVGAGLGMNATLRRDTTAGPGTQTLPLIRANAPAIGSSPNNSGVGDTTGLFVIVKNQLGGNSLDVVPNTSEVPPDTIEGGAGPVVIPPGGSRIFQSDGVANWIIVGGYL